MIDSWALLVIGQKGVWMGTKMIKMVAALSWYVLASLLFGDTASIFLIRSMD